MIAIYPAAIFFRVYISVAAVTAAIGFALTASHLEEPQVTKGSCPFRSVPFEGALRSKTEGELTLGLMSGGNQKRTRCPVGARLAREKRLGDALIQTPRVIVDVHRQQAGSYRGMRTIIETGRLAGRLVFALLCFGF
nr:hypothetical protein [Pseudomonas sp. SJZ080]